MMNTRILPSLLKRVVVPCAAALAVCGNAEAGVSYLDPSGGWTYSYAGSPDTNGSLINGAFDSLDGTWDANGDTSRWDGSKIGTVLIDPNLDLPGGAMSLTESSTTYLRIQDTGDPGDYPNIPGGGTNNDNRRIGFVYDLSADGASDTVLNSGVTLSFRARIPTSGPLDEQYPNFGGGTTAWPAGGKGYPIFAGGKGMFSIKQNSDDALVSFSLTNGSEDGYSGPGLAMNSLNGTSPSAAVDAGEGTERLFSVTDPTEWHEFWATIESGGAGTHQVTVYADGSTGGTTFDVTTGNTPIPDYSDISYLAMALGNSGEFGAVDVDFVSWKSGVIVPEAAPVPVSLTVNRITGDMWLNNNGPGDLDLRGYSITSDRGALNASEANWLTITGNYDVDGNLSVDDNDEWTVLTDPRIDGSEDMSEYEFGGDGGTIGVGESVLLSKPSGIGTWIPSPDENDLVVNLSLAGDQNGTVIQIPVIYEGNNDQKLSQSDLNHDGNITGADWIIFQSYSLTDLSGLSVAQQYLRGDLNGDGKNNPNDFLIFKSDYEDFNGLGSFAHMLQSIPEPSSLTLLVICLACSFAWGGRRKQNRTSIAILAIGMTTFIVSGPAARASVYDDAEAYWSFDTDFTDATGNHNGTGSGDANITSTAGEYVFGGGALKLDGDGDYLSIADVNLSGDFTVAAWIHPANMGTGTSGDLGGAVLFGDGPSGNSNWVRPSEQKLTIKVNDSTQNILPLDEEFVNNEWQHLAVSRTASGDYLVYRNGVEIGPDWNGETGDQILNYIGVKSGGYYEGFIDDAALWNRVLDPEEISQLAEQPVSSVFSTLISPATGATMIYNATATPITFDNYWIKSPAGALLAGDGAWNSLDDQDYDANGSGTGESWDESGGSNATQISESYLLGSSTLNSGEFLSIGKPYNTSVVDTNMTMQYHDVTVSEALSDGHVKFIVPGDMDDDGVLTEADVPLFIQALTNRATFEAHPNATPLSADFVGDFDGDGLLDFGDIKLFSDAVNEATASAQASAVPEPATYVLLIGLALMGCCARLVR